MTQVIQHVSDTSFWVAHYRAVESERKDALFKDPFAKILVGDFVKKIETLKSPAAKWTQWSVCMRTVIIDQMILDLVEQGGKTFINIGAGLDSRPYRMNLGANIHWIEIDFPHVIEHKKKLLQKYNPTCNLEWISLDLSNRKLRNDILAELAKKYSNIAVLTEGVLPYLSEEQVSELSEDLRKHSAFRYWIGEYISSRSYKYLKNPKRMKVVEKAPFQFFPPDWMGFFKSRGWRLKGECYYIDVSEKLGRSTPMPAFFKVLEFFKGKEWAAPYKKMSGFLIWERG